MILADRISKDLSEWRGNLTRFLDADYFSTSLLVPIFQRQRNVLNLNYWHAIILTYRPFLLSHFSGRNKNVGNVDPQQIEDNVQQCLAAALSTVNEINDMTQGRQMFRAFLVRVQIPRSTIGDRES